MPRTSHFPRAPFARDVTVWFALFFALTACAQGLGPPLPSVHVSLAGVATDAQLIQQLQAQGYTDIKVTPNYPNRFDPRPEIVYGFSSPNDEDARDMHVHFGWNGTAVKNGRTVGVYVDSARERQRTGFSVTAEPADRRASSTR